MPEVLIEANALEKRFDDFVAVDGIDFTVTKGESFGFLGPNGAGKTSTMRMIGAVSPISGGSLSVLGLDPSTDGPRLRSRLGVVPQDNNLDEELPVVDNLMMYGRYFDLDKATLKDRIDELLEFVQLTEKRTARVESLSGGMKRRLSLGISLIGDPKILLLDEPSTGVDPDTRRAIWDIISRENKQAGRTIILTTHSMLEADTLSTRIGIMSKGRLKCLGTQQHLKAKYGEGHLLTINLAPADDDEERGTDANVQHRVDTIITPFVATRICADARLDTLYGHVATYILPSVKVTMSKVFSEMEGNKKRLAISDWGINQSSLEEVFVKIVTRDESESTE